MAYAPTVNVLLDDAPAPRTEVVFTSLPAGTASLRAIRRLGEDREYRVRGSIEIAVTDQVARLDYEAPFGIPITYRAEALNAGGDSIGFTDSSTPVTLNVNNTYVHNPLDPQVSVKVRLEDRTSHEWSRPVSGDIAYPIGRRVGVVVGGARSGLRGQTFWIWIDDPSDVEKFAAMVGDYNETKVPVLCFRIAADVKMRVPRPFFGSAFDPREIDIDLSNGGDTVGFSIASDEAAPPTPALVVPLLTRADLDAYYSTRAALDADNASRLAVNRRYDLAGSA